MGRKDKKRSKKRRYQYAVKRPTISKKDVGRGFKALMRGGVKGRDIRRAGKKLKKKYGCYPRGLGSGLAGRPEQRHSAAGRQQQQASVDRAYSRLDGGTEDTMYIKGPAPGG